MINFKHLLAAAVLLCGSTVIMAQSETTSDDGLDYKPYPYMFVNVQGGMQTTLTSTFSQYKLITPTVSGSFGAFFTPVIGARLHVNGGWNKGGFTTDPATSATPVQDIKYNYNYVTTNVDLMVNLVTLFGKKNYYPLNVYLIGGIGLDVAFNNEESYAMSSLYPAKLENAWNGTKLSHNGRIGLQIDYNIAKHWSINAEFDANSLNDRYNSKKTGVDDWSLTAQVGVTYKFGFKKKPTAVAAPTTTTEAYDQAAAEAEAARLAAKKAAAEEAARIEAAKAAEAAAKAAEAAKLSETITFRISESDPNGSQVIAKAAEWCKQYPNKNITVSGYADKGTGTPAVNMKISQKRADRVAAALKAQGVSADRITVKAYGDTVQPYPNNDDNRCTIVVGE